MELAAEEVEKQAMTYSEIRSTRLLPPRSHARSGSGKVELELECGHVTWRARSELKRNGKQVERVLCRTCTSAAPDASVPEVNH